MLEDIKAMILTKDRDITITSENPGDAHIDGLDAFLIWNPRTDDEIPMMTAVYAGYSLYFSSPHPTNEGLRSWVMAQGRDFIWGSQLGWMPHRMPKEFMDYFRTLGKLRVATRDFLTYGELVGELTPIGATDDESLRESLPARVDPPLTTAVWPWWGVEKLAKLPVVMSAVWRAQDGRLGLFIVNLTETPRTFHHAYDPSEFGLHADALSYARIEEDGQADRDGTTPGGIQVRKEELPPFGVAVYEVDEA